MSNQRKAGFLDRDGVINKTVSRTGSRFPTSPISLQEFEIFPRVTEALALLTEIGFLRILVTNQPDVRKRLVSPEVWAEMQNRVMNLGFDCAYICPHLTGDNCDCKKPKPGMLLAAAKRWNLDLPSCYMIGDTAAETGAARNTGCKSILIRASYNEGIKSDCVAEDLLNAVLLIWKLERGRL